MDTLEKYLTPVEYTQYQRKIDRISVNRHKLFPEVMIKAETVLVELEFMKIVASRKITEEKKYAEEIRLLDNL